MIDFIYTVFIAPLEYWMRVVLVWGHGVCEGNWGWAIVLMSLVVNTVILPIYMKAESWQEQEQKLRLGFEAKEAMIKRAFHGQERFAMISTMRRQAGYTAFLSMRSSVGFFLQIPFFFAAYHFLSHFDPLSGVSFLGLADLGKPDEALHIGSFAVNVMPILMTVINIGSALIYTKHLARRDKIQLYAMAALFLVLLYDAASGLVLYWTCNNIYSLAKNIVYDVVRKFARCFKTKRFRFLSPNREKPLAENLGVFGRDIWGLVIWLSFKHAVCYVRRNGASNFGIDCRYLLRCKRSCVPYSGRQAFDRSQARPFCALYSFPVRQLPVVLVQGNVRARSGVLHVPHGAFEPDSGFVTHARSLSTRAVALS